MNGRSIVALLLVAALVVGAILSLKHFRLAVLSPAEIAPKRIAPPLPPDDSCDVARRASSRSSHTKQRKPDIPLGEDEIAIYRAVIQQWDSNSGKRLNVSNRTFPLVDDQTDCRCLKGIDLESLTTAAYSFHALTRDILPPKIARLVDANTQAGQVAKNDPDTRIPGSSVNAAVDRALDSGLFSLSEIAFDKEHRRGLVGYSFVCGSLCGNGGVWLFEKVNGVWKKSEHVCGGWIS